MKTISLRVKLANNKKKYNFLKNINFGLSNWHRYFFKTKLGVGKDTKEKACIINL